jgi:thiol-disulfide isomerase/thioredoxin/ASC-1-like (ASCH) protein
MKMMPDSTFTAVIETKQDKIKFVIIVGSISGSNGTQEEAEYEFDARRGIYLTVLKAVDGKVEVNFDPAKLPQSEAKSTIKFGKESIVSKVAKLYWDYNSFSQEYINAFINTMLNNKKNTFDFDEPIKKFDELYINESNQFVKQIIVLLQAQLASLSQSKDDFKEKIANRLIEEIKLDSYLLNFNPGQWIGTVFEPRKKEIANEAARRGFVDKYIELSTISKEEKVKLVLSLLQGAKAAYNEPLRKKYFDLIMSKYADTESAKKAKEFSDEFQLVVGSPIPKFSLVSHDDPKITFTNDSFKGKIYMIDFWATWCGPCKAEMPELHKVYEKFKNKGFEILSISFDQTADAIDKYRKGEWKMPWLHAFVDGEIKAKLQKDFDAMAIPKPFLVDGNTGRILALTTDLRGENLEKTIEKFLK